MKKNIINPKNVRLARLNQRTCTRTLSEIVNMDEETYAVATLNGNSKKADIVEKMKNGYDECLSGKFPCIPEPLFFFAFPEYAKEDYHLIDEFQATEMLYMGKGIDEKTHYTLLGGNTRFATFKKLKMRIPSGLFVDVCDRITGKSEVHYGRLFSRFQNNLKKSLQVYLRLIIMFLIMYYNNDARTQGQDESRTFNAKFIEEYMSKKDYEMSGTNFLTAEVNLFDGCGTPFDKKEALESFMYCNFKQDTTENAARKMAALLTDMLFAKKGKTLKDEDTISKVLKSCGVNPQTSLIESKKDFENVYTNIVVCENGQESKGDISYISSKAKKHLETGNANLKDISEKIANDTKSSSVKKTSLDEFFEKKEMTLIEICTGLLKYFVKKNINVKLFLDTFKAVCRNEGVDLTNEK